MPHISYSTKKACKPNYVKCYTVYDSSQLSSVYGKKYLIFLTPWSKSMGSGLGLRVYRPRFIIYFKIQIRLSFDGSQKIRFRPLKRVDSGRV